MNKPSPRRPHSAGPLATEHLSAVRGGWISIIKDAYEDSLAPTTLGAQKDSPRLRDTNSTIP